MRHSPDRLRNVAFVGHAGAGKTSLIEAILHRTGATSRLGSVTAGTPVTDHEPEERQKQHSLYTAVAHASWQGHELNLIDTPGYPDFFAEARCAVPAADIVCIVVDARDGVLLNTRKAWQLAEAHGLARLIVVNGVDQEGVDVDALVTTLRETFGSRCVWFRAPRGSGAAYAGDRDALAEGSPEREGIIDAAVETDEALTEKYLEQGAVSADELARGILAGCRSGAIVPMIATSATKELGVEDLLDVVCRYLPGPLEATRRRGTKGEEVAPDGPFLAQVFKVAIGEHGAQSFIRVFAGEATSHTNIVNLTREGKEERTHEFQRPQGKAVEPLAQLVAGDIAIIPKLDTLSAGDTITTPSGASVVLPGPVLPAPMVALAVTPRSRADEAKLRPALDRLQREDPSFHAARNEETHELVVHGMSHLHLEAVLHRMKERTKVEVDHHPPRIAYRETIRAKGDARYRHKKQSGGAGEFGEVALRVLPAERGEGFSFVSKVVGGVVSASFMPAIEKGVVEAMREGVVAGFPVVDVRVEVYDGKEHPVDSKEVAFKKAGRGAFRQAVEQARPALLEPILLVEITAPEAHTGDILGDLARRRSQPQGMEQTEEGTVIRALVPEAELQGFSQDLRALTSGEGAYTTRLDHHEFVPPDEAQRLIDAHRRARTEERD
jgi:elongation factor G